MEEELGKLKISHDGYWYWCNNQLTNENILKLFASSIFKENDTYYIRLKGQTYIVTVEKVPFVIESVLKGEESFIICLRDSRRIIWPESIIFLIEDVPYTSLRFEKDALISRKAWWQLQQYMYETDGEYEVRYDGKRWPIKEN